MSRIAETVLHPVASTHHIFEEVDLPEGIQWTRIRYWAAKNALTLIFLSAMFIITWTLVICLTVFR